MLELIGPYDIFRLAHPGEAICITTNGITKKDGSAVMGKGIALSADRLFNLSPLLGVYLRKFGNRCFNMGMYQYAGFQYNVITFPTKHHWRYHSDIELICKSCRELTAMCDKFGFSRCYLVPPGCSNGQLNYERDVRPHISQLLDDRFIVVLSNL